MEIGDRAYEARLSRPESVIPRGAEITERGTVVSAVRTRTQIFRGPQVMRSAQIRGASV